VYVELDKDSWSFLSGELWIEILDGEIEVFGAKYSKGETIYLPEHRAAPLYSPTKCKLNITFGNEGFISESKDPLIPESWNCLFSLLEKTNSGYKVMVIGNVDTGKTGLITYLANKLFLSGKKIGLIDADTGQSDIGPPTTIGLGTIEHPIIHLSEAILLDAFFVGNVTPAGILQRSIIGTLEMIRRAIEYGMDIILIDTTGWVCDRWGRELKMLKYLAVHPDLVVFIEKREDELLHLKRALEGYGAEFFHVESPPRVKMRPREERREIRAEMFRKEFEDAREIVVSLDSLGVSYGFLGTGKEPSETALNILSEFFGEDIPYVEESEDALLILTDHKVHGSILEEIRRRLNKREIINITPNDIKHLLVAFTDFNGRFLGLGVILDFDIKTKKLLVWTRARLDILANIQFGHIKININGEEEGKFNPWLI